MKKDTEPQRSSAAGGEHRGAATQRADSTQDTDTESASTSATGGDAASQQPARMSGRGPGAMMHRQFAQSPFSLVRRISDELDRVFDTFFGSSGETDWREWSRSWPQIDVSQSGDSFTISADLPGVQPDDVRIHVENDTLVIEGERRNERQSRESGYARSERSYGSFRRAIRLPAGANLERADARFRDGVLEITVPCEARHTRSIPIQSGEQGAPPQRRSAAGTTHEEDRKRDKAS